MDSRTPARLSGTDLTLRVRVTPRARRNGLEGLAETPDGPALKVAVTAPPEDGKANTAVLKTLSKALGIPRSSLDIRAGKTSRNKTVSVSGDAATLQAVLEAVRIQTHRDGTGGE